MKNNRQLKIWLMRHHYLTNSLALLFLVGLMLILLMIPISSKIGELNSSIRVSSKKLKSLEDRVVVVSELNDAVLSDRLDVLDRALPSKKDVVLYLSVINNLSRELGVSFADITLSPGDVTEASVSAKKKELNSGLQSLETEIKIIGTEERLYKFLKLIEGVAPLMQVKNVQITSFDKDNYVLSLKLAMLWAPKNDVKLNNIIKLFTDKEEKYFRILTQLRIFPETNFSELDSQSTNIRMNDLFSSIKSQQKDLLQSPLPQ